MAIPHWAACKALILFIGIVEANIFFFGVTHNVVVLVPTLTGLPTARSGRELV